MDTLQVVNAHEHNLKHVSLTLPRDRLIVFTGVSGSGKSSLAFDTIFAEGQRRFVESLSAYARQYIGQFEKPKVERVDGLSPAIAIDQKSGSRSPRSTVGTVTEITDYLRVLYARIGTPHCPHCGQEITPQSLQRIVERLWELPDGARLQVLAPIVRGRKGEYNALFRQLRKEGIARAVVDNELLRLDELPEDFRLAKTKVHTIEAVIDRIVLKHDEGTRLRLVQAVQTALKKADGFVHVQQVGEPPQSWFFSEHLACPACDLGDGLPELAPRLFSFNSPYGACPACDGLGIRYEVDEALLVPDPSKTLAEGAIAPLQKILGRSAKRFLEALGERYRLRLDVPYAKLTDAERQRLWAGPGTVQKGQKTTKPADSALPTQAFDELADAMADLFDGVLTLLQRVWREGSEKDQAALNDFVSEQPCATCHGARLKPMSLAVTLGGLNLHELGERSIADAHAFLLSVRDGLSESQWAIGRQALQEATERLRFLLDVGLDYLTLNRRAATLSGGEAQRIRLATQVGAGLSGVLYVLDEPSIGLHPHNNDQLIRTLLRLRDLGNTLIVVEHDEDTIRAADWVVDIGPYAGVHGGRVIAEGPPAELIQNPRSLTGQYLSGHKSLLSDRAPRSGSGERLTVTGATLHNLKDLTVSLPLGTLMVVTGLSGSGKSTLVFDVLYPALRHRLSKGAPAPRGVQAVEGVEHLDKVIVIDQSPIGRTSRSNPATYTGVFDLIRSVFAATEAAQVRGFGPGRFSFNQKAGRCAVCNGEGQQTLAMNFLPDVHTVCEACQGRRFNPETLAVTYQGHSIADVLAMTVGEAHDVFARQPRIQKMLAVLKDVGLDYLTLGQSATTLSGGEAQRLKLATEFCRPHTGRTLYLMDEPTVGLHWQDLDNLLRILNRLVDAGNTVLVIEHQLDLIRAADHLIDLGPEGGARGGELVIQGTPAEVAACEASYTGQALRRHGVLASV